MAEDSFAQDQIKAFVDRILRLKSEVKEINADVREIYAEAKGCGFDKTVLGKLASYVEKRQDNSAAVEESESIFDLYLTAYDSASGKVGTVRATHTHASEAEQNDQDEVDAQKSRLAALRADPSLAVVDKPQSPPQAERAPVIQSAVGDAQFRDPNDWEDEDTAPEPQPGKSVEASASAAPAPMYAEPGVVTWESTPPEGVARSPYSNLFGTMGQDMAVIEDELEGARSAPIVKIGNLIIDGWARYVKACSMFTELKVDGETKRVPLEYPVVQYAGTDPLMDCIRWNVEGRMMTPEQKFKVAQSLARMEPKRKADIYASFELGMELA